MNHKHLSGLASACQIYAANCSFQDQDSPKSTLLEASHFIDSRNIKTYHRGLSVWISNARGKRRKLTLRERFAVWVMRGSTEILA